LALKNYTLVPSVWSSPPSSILLLIFFSFIGYLLVLHKQMQAKYPSFSQVPSRCLSSLFSCGKNSVATVPDHVVLTILHQDWDHCRHSLIVYFFFSQKKKKLNSLNFVRDKKRIDHVIYKHKLQGIRHMAFKGLLELSRVFEFVYSNSKERIRINPMVTKCFIYFLFRWWFKVLNAFVFPSAWRLW